MQSNEIEDKTSNQSNDTEDDTLASFVITLACFICD